VGAEKIGRCQTPNDSPVFIEALADIVQVNSLFC
jgi:protoheme ferro-lyase